LNKEQLIEKLKNPPMERIVSVSKDIWGNKSEDRKLITDLPEEEQIKVLEWIDTYMLPLKRGKKRERATSYGIKHLLERCTGIYLTNNQFKDATDILGYKIIGKKSNLNWDYRICELTFECERCSRRIKITEVEYPCKIIGFDGTKIILCRNCFGR